jgi:gluconolactonase
MITAMKGNSRRLLFIGLLLCAQSLFAQEELFKSSVFTPVNSFTSGSEGPGVDKQGNVYAVNFAKEGTVGIVTPSGEASLFVELPQGSTGNGIRFNKNGDMYIADYTGHNVLKVDMKSKAISVLAHIPTTAQPNDIAIDADGRVYASDPDWKGLTGRLWRVDPDGKVALMEGNMLTVNGIEVGPDNKTLYVGRGPEVLLYDLKDGNISNKRTIYKFEDLGMDGMRCDIAGNIYVTRPGKGLVVKISPEGKVLQEIKLLGKKPSNIAFGGKDGRTAYVTMQDTGNIETFRVDLPGREWKMKFKK